MSSIAESGWFGRKKQPELINAVKEGSVFYENRS